jgi:hypothetical protein
MLNIAIFIAEAINIGLELSCEISRGYSCGGDSRKYGYETKQPLDPGAGTFILLLE